MRVPQPSDIARTPAFRAGIDCLAEATRRSVDSLNREVRGYLKEMRTSHHPLLGGAFLTAGRVLCSAGYDAIDYDPAQVERLREVFARHAVVVLSSHRSYLDGGAITIGFADRGLPRLTGFSGINLAFWPLGAIWRRAGVVFIRRSAESPVYRFALQQFLAELVAARVHMTWFIEGTRSRTGKLAPPKLGLLFHVVDAYLQGRAEDLLLLPVSVSYDQLQEVEEFAGEARGHGKRGEGLSWLFGFARSQRGRFGTIYVRFGEPVSLREALGPPGTVAADAANLRLAVQKLAFEVSWRINHATPITGSSLVTLALLGARGHALTVPQIRLALKGYLVHAKRHGFTVVASAALHDERCVSRILEALQDRGVVSSYVGGDQSVYRIGADEHLAAAYYRNSIVHFFLHSAILELAWLHAAGLEPGLREQGFWDEATALRDLLKFEFFFLDKREFQDALEAEARLLAADWRAQLARGREGIESLLERVYTLTSDMVLRSFVEAYVVVAEVLLQSGAAAAPAEAELLERCMGLGQQLLLQGRLSSPESVSQHLFRTGLKLARHRALCDAGAAAAVDRQEFAAALWNVIERMGTVHEVAVRRVAQLVKAEAA